MAEIMDFLPKEKIFTQKHLNGKEFVIMTVGDCTYAVEFSYWAPTPSTHIMIGKYCALARQLIFNIGRNQPYKNATIYPLDEIKISPRIKINLPTYRNPRQIIIGHDVWVGQGAMIMGGVKIGNGAVIGARAVVAKDIPPYAIAVGNPARVIKYRFDEETIRKFLAIKWWNWDLEKIAENAQLMTDVEKFVNTHYSPELENFPEDDLSRVLDNFINGGGYVYQFISDFRAAHPLWIKVVREFCQSDFENKLLIIYLGRDATDEDFKALATEVNRFGNDARKNILFIGTGEKNFSPAALRKGTHFITTREMVTLEALDYLWDTNVKIISGLDDKIFGG